MGKDKTVQENLFSYNASLDAGVRKDHVLRKIQQSVNFGFIYTKGSNTFTAKEAMFPYRLKMMSLLFFFDVRSEEANIRPNSETNISANSIFNCSICFLIQNTNINPSFCHA